MLKLGFTIDTTSTRLVYFFCHLGVTGPKVINTEIIAAKAYLER
jgi:hypothetical protein